MRSLKLFIATFVIVLPVFYGLSVIGSLQPQYDQYFALYTLGAGGLAEHYFPLASILPRIGMSWRVGVYNHMGTVQLVRVEFKILNLTMQGPNQENGTPGERDPFFEEMHLILSNETWILPVAWSVNNATTSRNATAIHSLSLNNLVITNNVEISALHGYDFRIVIELWVYDDSTGSFSFQWAANGERRVAWNQLWFNMTILPF